MFSYFWIFMLFVIPVGFRRCEIPGLIMLVCCWQGSALFLPAEVASMCIMWGQSYSRWPHIQPHDTQHNPRGWEGDIQRLEISTAASWMKVREIKI